MCPDDYTVEGEDGSIHMVEHRGGKMHPSDKGHAELAKRLLQAWERMPLSNGGRGKLAIN